MVVAGPWPCAEGPHCVTGGELCTLSVPSSLQITKMLALNNVEYFRQCSAGARALVTPFRHQGNPEAVARGIGVVVRGGQAIVIVPVGARVKSRPEFLKTGLWQYWLRTFL